MSTTPTQPTLAEPAGSVLAGRFDIETIEQAFFNHDHDGSELSESKWQECRERWQSFKTYLAKHPRQEIKLERAIIQTKSNDHMNKPIERGPCEVANECAELIVERSRVGLKKYGVTVDKNNLPALQWLQHYREELADALVYATRLQAVLDEKDAQIGDMRVAMEKKNVRILAMEAELQMIKSSKRKAKK